MRRGIGLFSERMENGVTEFQHRAPSTPPRSRYAWAVLAALTCPCHAPLFALLLAGTAAGAYLNEYLGVAVALMSVVFLLSLRIAIKRLNESGPKYQSVAE